MGRDKNKTQKKAAKTLFGVPWHHCVKTDLDTMNTTLTMDMEMMETVKKLLDAAAKEEFEDWLFDSGYRPSCDEEVEAVQKMVDKMVQNGNPYYLRHIESLKRPN